MSERSRRYEVVYVATRLLLTVRDALLLLEVALVASVIWRLVWAD